MHLDVMLMGAALFLTLKISRPHMKITKKTAKQLHELLTCLQMDYLTIEELKQYSIEGHSRILLEMAKSGGSNQEEAAEQVFHSQRRINDILTALGSMAKNLL